MTKFSKRDHFRVTTKAALYSPDGKKVVVTKILNPGMHSRFGLPGGHLDAGETPDQAIARELEEEIGAKTQGLLRKDFFMHANGKLVLGYIGELSESHRFVSAEPEKEHGYWMTKFEVEQASMNTVYKTFILDNWPDSAQWSQEK